MLGAPKKGPYLDTGDIVLSCGYRWFQSDKHFVGYEYQSERTREGSEVINRVHLLDFGLSYAVRPWLSVSASLPYLIAERSSPIRDWERHVVARSVTHSNGIGDLVVGASAWVLPTSTFRSGNVSLGLGLKIPTGNYHVVDVTRSYTAPALTARPVDQSIQPGDGGFGLVASLNAFKKLWNFTLYLNGSYLMNPRGHNGVPTGRGAFEELMGVPDQYVGRTGALFRLPFYERLSLGLGARIDGSPVHDLIGSDDFRRPGFTVAVEPTVLFGIGGFTFSGSVPVSVVRNRPRSATDALAGRDGGDAAFADFVLIFNASYSFNLEAALGAMAAKSLPPSPRATVVPPAGVADVPLKTLDGRDARVRDRLAGKLTVVNLWASWCEPCKVEMPTIVRMKPEIEGRGARLVSISVDKDVEAARAFAASQGMDFQNYIGGPNLLETIGEHRIPTTLFLDEKGDVVLRLRDVVTEESLRAALNTFLPAPAVAPAERADPNNAIRQDLDARPSIQQ